MTYTEVRAKIADLESSQGPVKPDEFAHLMRRLAELDDPEYGHGLADDLIIVALKRAGYAVGAEIFDEMRKWYA